MKTQVSVQTPSASSDSPGGLLLNLGGGLGFVLIVIVGLAWLARRFGFASYKRQREQLISVKSSCSVGQRERVVVVEIDNTWLLLGVTSSQITHLHTMEAGNKTTNEMDVTSPVTNFQTALAGWLKKGCKPE